MKKILKTFIIGAIVLILNMLILLNSTYAVNLGNVNIYSAGDCGQLLKYNGIVVKTTYAEYKTENGANPAYCLNKTLEGVGEVGAYDVDASEKITDVGLWRVIINGYPYKSLDDLGVNNKEEAFTATKQAVYCYIHGNDINNYEAIGEAGKRTLEALKQIVNNANSSSETQKSNLITINKNLEEWKQEGKYLIKHYNIISPANMDKYTVRIEKENNELPEGIKIVNENDDNQNEFQVGEEFKVIIPIQNLKTDGTFKLIVNGNIYTKPVLYAKPDNSNYQDYALTGIMFDDGKGEAIDNYYKNSTQITIDKKDIETGEKLQGTEFELLNENKNIIYTNLVTNENGKIIIKGVMPGKYFLRETKAKDGYVKTDKLIEINVKYNQDFTITVDNTKEEQPKIEYIKENKEVIIKKLPVTGM
ncbi:MAG: Cys-Gln thioester bond-forming surface protein [Clostridia bacterium]|nr:Cys-Gln thioester bond-forming surface protein [Clostridia bacterium]